MTARVVVACHDAGGTIPPVLALADALVATGSEVTVLSQPSVRVRAEGRGCRFTAFSQLPDYDRHVRLEEQLTLTLPAIAGPEVGDDLARVATEVDADLLVVDANLSGALAAAEVAPQPSVVLLHSMYATFVDTWFGTLWPLVGELVNATRAGLGADPADGWAQQFDAHDRILAVVPELFDAPVARPPAQLRRFGFLVPDAPAAAGARFPDGESPTVLVGLSTGQLGQEALLTACVEAIAGLGARGLVTTAGVVDASTVRAPDGIVVVDHVPHPSVLPETDVVVTHAGLGTVSAALAAGVPLVCAPLDRDQPLNADRVVELGAGVRLDVPVDAAAIASGLERVLGDATHRSAAERIAAASRAEGGPAAAAADLLGLV